MDITLKKVYDEAITLPPSERAELVEKIMSSFKYPAQQEMDTLWAKEAEERLDAYEKGLIGSTPSEEVFKEIDRLR
ncbi:MAG: addiction module protein [Kiritimatiellae bacterium]|nr:addiction module protein [Kiritimatiellia bacterium]